METINHYKWLDKHLDDFWINVFGSNLSESGYGGIVSSHGDKGNQYKSVWGENGIPFPHAMALFMLTYTNLMDVPKQYSANWVIDNYPKYCNLLPEIDENDMDVICPFTIK